MRSAVDEGSLWERARAGEPEARGALGQLAREVAERELRARRARPQELPDLVQETLRSTFAFLEQADEAPRELRAFLKFRAWGVLSDQRKMRRQPTLDDPTTLEQAPAHGHAAATSGLVGAELAAALEDCLERLGPEQRQAVEMRYTGEVDADPPAAQLSIARSTLHVRVFRALEKLRECLGRKGWSAGDLA